MQSTKIFGLGGMQEIGKTTIIIEHDDELVIVDTGIKFTNSAETGVQAIIPDYTYLKQNQEKIKGIFITHGHEDHIGGIPHLLKVVNIPEIHAPRLAIQLIKEKLKEHAIANMPEFYEITPEFNHKTKHFELDCWTTQHSIPDAFGIRVKTPNGDFFYTGDFRFDYTPFGNMTDFTKLEQMGKENLTLMLSDSTNAFSAFHSPTEREIVEDIEKVMKATEGKFVVTTFASQLLRIQTLIEIGARHGRKVVLLGRSIVKNVDFAKKIGYINVEDNTFIDKKEIHKYEDSKLMIFSSGSQGEENAALNRIAMDKHAQIKLGRKDTVLFSSSPIPGNRMKIEQMVNQLYKTGVNIKEHKIDGIFHVSGHAYKEELEKVFSIAKPDYFIPMHGTYRMSASHVLTGIKSGLKPENCRVLDNGQVIYMKDRKITFTDEYVDDGPIYIDSNNATSANVSVIKSRENLGENGFVNVVVSIDREKKMIVGRTRIISRGTLYAKTSKERLNEVQKMAHGAILYIIKNNPSWTKEDIKKTVQERIQNYFYKYKRRKPIVLTSIIDYSKKPIDMPKPLENNNNNNRNNNQNRNNNNQNRNVNNKPKNKQFKPKAKVENKPKVQTKAPAPKQ